MRPKLVRRKVEAGGKIAGDEILACSHVARVTHAYEVPHVGAAPSLRKPLLKQPFGVTAAENDRACARSKGRHCLISRGKFCRREERWPEPMLEIRYPEYRSRYRRNAPGRVEDGKHPINDRPQPLKARAAIWWAATFPPGNPIRQRLPTDQPPIRINDPDYRVARQQLVDQLL